MAVQTSLGTWIRTGTLESGVSSPEGVAAFRAQLQVENRVRLERITLVLSGFNLFFWATDAWVFRALPGVAEKLARGRLALVAPGLAVVLGLRFTRASVYLLGTSAALAVCLVVGTTLGSIGGPSTPWFHFLHTFLLAPAFVTFRPLERLAVTLALGVVCVLGFFGPHPEYLHDPHAATTLAHFSYVAALSAILGWSSDASRLREFLSKRELREERAALASRVAEATAALRRLVRHRDEVQDAERARVARELHDELGQCVTALRLVLKTARSRYARDPAAIEPNLSQLGALLQQLTDDTRRIVSDLRPRILDDLGLAPALDWLAARTTERGVPCAVTRHGDADGIPAPLAAAAFRCAQEALTNVLKHARASRAEVTLRCEGGSLELTVEDDGVGFDPAAVRDGSFGLAGMRERALALGGTVETSARVPRGAALRVRLPITSPEGTTA